MCGYNGVFNISILSIIVVILFYFIIKYAFRVGTLVLLLKLVQQFKENMIKNKIKRGDKKWDLFVKNVIENLTESKI